MGLDKDSQEEGRISQHFAGWTRISAQGVVEFRISETLCLTCQNPLVRLQQKDFADIRVLLTKWSSEMLYGVNSWDRVQSVFWLSQELQLN